MVKISLIQEKEIINKYLNGEKTKALSVEYNCHTSTITNYLKKYNIPAGLNSGNLTPQIENEIINGLKNFENVRDLMKKFKVRHSTITKIAKKHNFKITKIKYSFNENYFETINTKDKSYFLGLLYADGSNFNNRILITLQKKDDYILKEFSKKLNCNGNFKFKNSKIKDKPNEYTTFALSHKKISSDLTLHGCFSNKSLKLKYPEHLSSDLFWSFIRGIFDGDGNFYYQKSKNKTNWSIISNISFCEEIQVELLKRGISSKIYQNKNKHKDIAEIRVMAHADIKKIFHYMYEGNDNLYLTRKYYKFIEFLEYNYNCRYSLESVKQKYICKKVA